MLKKNKGIITKILFAVFFFLCGVVSGNFLFKSKSDLQKKFPSKSDITGTKILNRHFQDESPNKNKTKLPFYIHETLNSMGIKGGIPDKSSWQDFMEKIKVEKVKELEDIYKFDLLSAIISDTGRLPGKNFFNEFNYDFSKVNEKSTDILTKGIFNLKIDDLKRLIEMGIDVNGIDNVFQENELRRKRLLNLVLWSDHDAEKKFNYLVENGLSFDKGEDFLFDAMVSKESMRINGDLVDRILKKTAPNGAIKPTENAVYKMDVFDLALQNNASTEMIDYFLNNGFDVYNNNGPKVNIFARLIYNKNSTPSQLQKLIDIAGTAEYAVHEGFTPIKFAVKSNRPDFVKVLLDNGAIVDESVYKYVKSDYIPEAHQKLMIELLNSARK